MGTVPTYYKENSFTAKKDNRPKIVSSTFPASYTKDRIDNKVSVKRKEVGDHNDRSFECMTLHRSKSNPTRTHGFLCVLLFCAGICLASG
jgi:hypothetical protein